MVNLLIYLSVMMLVLSVSFLHELIINKKEANCFANNINNIIYKPVSNPHYLFIVTVSMILALYSASLGATGGLVDRVSYEKLFSGVIPHYMPVEYNFDGIINSMKDLMSLDEGREQGYLFFNLILRKFTDNSYWLFFSVTFIYSFMNLYVLSKITNKYTVFIFFLFISYFFYINLILLRQALAVAFSNVAIWSLMKDKKFKFFVFSIIAYSFHRSSVILLLFFVLTRIKSKKIYIYLSIGFVILFFTFNSFMSEVFGKIVFLEKYLKYVTLSGEREAGGTFLSMFKGTPFYLLSILALIKYDKLSLKVRNSHYFVLSTLMCAYCFLLNVNMYWVQRISLYFLFPTLFFIPMLINTIVDKKLRLFFSLLVILSFLAIICRQVVLVLGDCVINLLP